MPSFARAWSTNRYGHFECTTRTTTRVLRSREWPRLQGDASAYRPWHSVLGGEDEMHMASWNNAGSCHHWPVELLVAQLWAAHAQYMEARARCIEVFDNAEPESSSDDDSTGAKPPPPWISASFGEFWDCVIRRAGFAPKVGSSGLQSGDNRSCC